MSSRGEHNFIVKAEYRGITRKFSFDHFPVWNELFQQLYKVFRIDHYYLSRLLLSAQDDTQRILIARESHSAQQYNVQVAPFLSTHNHWGLLRFSVCDEKARKAPISPPRRFTIPTVLEQMDVDDAPYRPLPVPPAPASWWTNATSVPTSAPSVVSSSSSSAKEEVKQLMDSFFIDLNNTLSKFGISQADVTGPPASADTDMRDAPSASNSAAPEIRIPGSFVDAPTPRATTPVSRPVSSLHPDVWCDACNDPVRGIRHKCMVCWNFDLCDTCINKPGIQETHSNGAAHPFKAINPPGEDSSPVVDPAPHFGATHNVACDVCQELIVGSRYKCTQCLDYDMCRGCYTKYRGAHRLEHDFAVSHIPGASPKPASPIRLPVVPPNVPSTSSRGPGNSTADWANWKPTFQTFGPAAGSRTAPEAVAAAATPTPARVPRDTTDLPVHGASCDSCSETIRGVRHKCLDCEDFDFCDECITTARHTHNEAHTFYAIAIPGTVIVHKVYDDVPAVAPLPAQPPPPSQPAPGALSSGELARMRLRKSIANRHEAMHSRHRHGRGRSAPAADVPAPTPAPSPPVVHNASCDLCDSRITGDRYKCTRCPDYDVCSSCFAIVPEQHPHHAFVRIEKPKDIMTSQSEQFTTVHHAVCDSCNKHIIGVRYKCLHADCPDVDFCQHCEALPIPVHPFNHPLVKFKYDFTTESPEIRSVFKYAQRKSKSKSAKSPTTETLAETLVDVSCPPVSSNVTPTTPYASEISHSQTTFVCPPEVQVMIPRAESPKDINEDYFPGVPKDDPHSQSAPAPTTAEEPPQMEQRASTPSVTLPTRSAVLATPPPPPAPVLPPAPTPVEEEKIDASFVEDNNIPDGHAFPAGAEFVKSWRLGNTGNVAWPEDTEIAFVSGDRVSGDGAPDAYAVGHVSPGEEVDVHALDMKAPEEAGTYTSTWRLRHGKTEYFGDLVWCQITVVEHEASDESNMSASSIIIPPSAPAEDNSIHPAQSAIALSLTARSATMSAAVSVVSDSAGSPVSSISAFSDHSGMWSEVADQRDEANAASATAPRHIEQPDYVLVYDSSDDDSD